jgi:colanic acid biosynthesis glycosyl transferase WcaI
MNVLITSLHYAPDLGPAAPLHTMLCEGLVKRGHKVTVIAGVPHYPSGQVQPAFRGRSIRHSLENCVEVIRLPLPSLDRARLAKRLLQFLCYQFGATWAGLGRREFSVVLVHNPGLLAWLPFATLVTVRRKPSVYSV